MNAIRPILPETSVRANKPRVSFEFFPPRTEALENQLWDSIRKLEPLGPSFVSVTYGAGGSTRDRTHRIVSRIVRETSLKPAAHLTTVSASRSEVDAVLRDYRNAGVRHIVALRGDPPGGVGLPYLQHPQGYASAIELTEAAARIGGFEISVAVHPEKHPASPTWEHEIDNFKRKLAAGATRGISQFFFDADVFLRFRDKLARAGVYAPVLPGIMPVTNVKGLKKMADACGASLPRWLIHLFEGLDDDPETRRLVTAVTTAQLCARLAAEGVQDFHFYTLNRADLALAICRILGLRAEEARA
ncbi:MAG: methylenetetrahydrofolate reductase [NAD(P)H] [Proteobacteria bacterium HN_bin10]|nr:MAG: methylenetetrahydrofolate reductase [NAD(P)H] [Proteobacteria bacterium HN_bin10]